MSKGQKRSNRELKKPKQDKPKAPVASVTSAFAPKPVAWASGKRK